MSVNQLANSVSNMNVNGRSQQQSGRQQPTYQRPQHHQSQKDSYASLAAQPMATTPQIPDSVKRMVEEQKSQSTASTNNNNSHSYQSQSDDSDDTNWKDKLKLPPKDNRIKTEDVQSLKSIEFEGE